MMSPLGLALITFAPQSSHCVERHGQRTMLLISLAFMTMGMTVLTLLPVWGGLVNVLTGICIFGIGFGLIVAPATSVVMVAIPKEKAAGDGSAVNMLSRQIGGAVGVAITGALASAIYRHGLSLSGFSLTESQQSAVERSLSGVIALNDQLGAATTERLDTMADGAMVNGVAGAMAICAVMTVLCAVVTYFALRKRQES